VGRDGSDERSDEELVAAVADGDRRALRLLYERHGPWLRPRLLRRCSDPTLVADAMQDTFVAVWRGASAYQGSGSVAAWIWGIGVRRLIGQVRARGAVRSTATADIESAVAEAGADAVLVSAEDLVLERVEHGDLAGAIDRLSPELRAVVQATVLDGLTTKEAGRLLGIPAGTVKTRMMRARRELRAALT
jgi:RNA polymerase sigma-70 factor (ECF subfamily)